MVYQVLNVKTLSVVRQQQCGFITRLIFFINTGTVKLFRARGEMDITTDFGSVFGGSNPSGRKDGVTQTRRIIYCKVSARSGPVGYCCV